MAIQVPSNSFQTIFDVVSDGAGIPVRLIGGRVVDGRVIISSFSRKGL